jgi:hypothetical protein
MGLESMSVQARWLGLAATIADLEWFTNTLAHLARITPEEIRSAAQRYLVPQTRTVGRYQPEAS